MPEQRLTQHGAGALDAYLRATREAQEARLAATADARRTRRHNPRTVADDLRELALAEVKAARNG